MGRSCHMLEVEAAGVAASIIQRCHKWQVPYVVPAVYHKLFLPYVVGRACHILNVEAPSSRSFHK